MNKLIMISSLAILASCASMKEKKAADAVVKAPVENVESAQENAAPTESRPAREEDMIDIIGTVRLDRPGCPVTIDMQKGDIFMTVYPVNLDRMYAKEGLSIKFSYAPSRAQSPESCTADMVVSVSGVEIIK